MFDNPNYDEAIWLKLYAKYKCNNDEDLFKKLPSFTAEDYGMIEKMLGCTNKNRAGKIFDSLYLLNRTTDENTYLNILNILKTILPFNYDKRTQRIHEAFAFAIKKECYLVFKLLLTTLDENDVDYYIAYNLEFAKNAKNNANKADCIDNVLRVHEGNVEALKLRFDMQFKCKSAPELIKSFEEILKYSSQTNETVIDTLCRFSKELYRKEHCAVAKQILKYYSGELAEIKLYLLNLAYRIIEQGFFEEAEYFLSLILTVDANNPDVYWGICLIKVKAKNESLIEKSDIPLKQVPEYTKYLTLVDESRRQHCINIANNQAQNIQKREEAERKRIEEERRIQIQKEQKEKKVKIAKITLSSVLAVALICIIVVSIVRKNNYEQAQYLMEKNTFSAYAEAMDLLEGLKGYKNADELYQKASYMYEGNYEKVIKKDNLTEFIIPEGTKRISASAFYKCWSLTSVTIPDSVTEIEKDAFYWCSYSLIVKDNGVHYVDNWVVDADSSITSATIKDGARGIANSAFYKCWSLTSVTIPDSVTEISHSAFYGCSSLTSIYYKGTKAEWNNISIGSSNYYLTSATRYYYSENNPFKGEAAVTSGNYWHYDTNGKIVVWKKQ